MPTQVAPSVQFIKRRVRPPVLVVSNCQTPGIANSMQSVTDEFKIVAIHIKNAQGKTTDYYIENYAKYEHLFVIPQLGRSLKEIPELASKTTLLPPVYFSGYHPDSIYVFKDGRPFRGIGDYHSCIAFSAFFEGCSEEETERFFNADVYQMAGYFQRWQSAKTTMMAQFRGLGFSAEDHFYRWCAPGAFMHTTNHPKIRVLADVAIDALRTLGSKIKGHPDTIEDGLASSVVFPVYPEIAAITGANGSYRFKPPATYETLNLREFIELSFASYRSVAPGDLAPNPAYRSQFETVSTVIRQEIGGQRA
jgi:hypothetical protein